MPAVWLLLVAVVVAFLLCWPILFHLVLHDPHFSARLRLPSHSAAPAVNVYALCYPGLQAKDVDILVSTCSIFCPTPSLGSMIVNHFGMRTDVQSYHLGGMGCSNGVVAVNLIQDLLKVRPALL
jgi:hypothetical protein